MAKNNLQMRADRLLGRQMVDISSGDSQAAVRFRAAASAGAILLDGDKVSSVPGVFEIQHAVGRDGVAEALDSTNRKTKVNIAILRYCERPTGNRF